MNTNTLMKRTLRLRMAVDMRRKVICMIMNSGKGGADGNGMLSWYDILATD